jgi:hypothetical protein
VIGNTIYRHRRGVPPGHAGSTNTVQTFVVTLAPARFGRLRWGTPSRRRVYGGAEPSQIWLAVA